MKHPHSPTHLIRFMESPFASWMDRYASEYPHLAPEKDPQDALATALQQRGFAHEDELETNFKEQGLSVLKIEGTQKHNATLSAMKQGFDVIVQARLEMNGFAGYADFLIKIEGKSNLGDFHYEVWDTKLSKQLKPPHLIQLCCYAEMLETIQGIRPKHIAVILGDGQKKRLKTDNYYQYYLQLKQNFLTAQTNFDPNNMPDPADFKSWGNWSTYAEKLLLEKDHLSQVANITRSQIKKLSKINILTAQNLIETTSERVPGLNPSIFQNLKKQAAIQKLSQGQLKPLYEVIIPEEDKRQGLSLLPPHSPLDVFFDIEGFPLYEGGLEYLWGSTYFNETGNRTFKDFWAHDREEEKQAFQNFILWAYKRWQQDPTMHIYHYANYEIAACRKLMGRFGVCEDEVDQLLRKEVFVDLYTVVKGSLFVGEPRYSIKNVERLYRDKRNTEVGSGSDSVVVYDNWRTQHAQGQEGRTWKESPILKNIRDYNIDDCDSTQELVDWLRERQKENNIPYLGKTEVETPEIKEYITKAIELRDRLLKNPNPLSENLAWTLEFHRREDKPVYWRRFDREIKTPEELYEDPDCLAFCQRTNRPPFKPTLKARNLAYEYRFDPSQEFKKPPRQFYLHGTDNKKVTYIPQKNDLEAGLIALQSTQEPKALISLIPDEIFRKETIVQSIYQVVSDYEANNLQNRAILHFLTRSEPSIKGHTGPIVTTTDPKKRLDQIIHAVENLDNSYLTIQGPPGAGKSYTAKHIIARLLKAGHKIGISSNSHKAINNLLLSTAKYCNENQINATYACTKNTDPALAQQKVTITSNPNLLAQIKPACLLGTTVWGYSRDDMADKLDYLFIDEAGQVSVANLIAMSRSAKNLILIGDQMQLGQPTQGTHPAESGLSILDYLLHDSPTISPQMGVFLPTTYRMHPALNNFISNHIYEGKLTTHPTNITRTLNPNHGKITKEAGLIYIPVPHTGNTHASPEEVQEIKSLTQELLTLTFSTGRKVTQNDILYVTPYNHQTRKLKEALGPQAKVGTVDKFQGQEAPIVILSMCTSDPTESPRGLPFLLNKNRLNVALSRAQTLALIIATPHLATTHVNSVEELELVSLFAAACSAGGTE